MKVNLVISKGSRAGRVIPVPESFFLIGRHPRCHLRAASPEVSRHHCTLLVDKERVLVRDLNSRTGTLVNEQPISGEVELQAGDRLQVGPLDFVVWLGSHACSEQPMVARTPSAPFRLEQADDEAAGAFLLAADTEPPPTVAPVPETASPNPSTPTTPPLDGQRQLAESERCDFANYPAPRRKLISGDASVAASQILKDYRYRRRGPRQ
jgi:predicted component of type VI protein secretion system